jgi:hypothetical protein
VADVAAGVWIVACPRVWNIGLRPLGPVRGPSFVSGQEFPRFWIFDLFSLVVGAAGHAWIVMFDTTSGRGMITCLGLMPEFSAGLRGAAQPGWDGRPAEQVAGVGVHADVAGDLDAIVAADRGDQVAQTLQAEQRVEAVPAGRDAGVDAGGRRRHGGQLQPEDPGVVADVGPSKRTGPRRPRRWPHPADIVEPMLGQRGRGRPASMKSSPKPATPSTSRPPSSPGGRRRQRAVTPPGPAQPPRRRLTGPRRPAGRMGPASPAGVRNRPGTGSAWQVRSHCSPLPVGRPKRKGATRRPAAVCRPGPAPTAHRRCAGPDAVDLAGTAGRRQHPRRGPPWAYGLPNTQQGLQAYVSDARPT